MINGETYIIRSKYFTKEGDKLRHTFVDGTRDNYLNGIHCGETLDGAHKLKWATEFDSYEEAEMFILKYANDDFSEWEIVTYSKASEDYYGYK